MISKPYSEMVFLWSSYDVQIAAMGGFFVLVSRLCSYSRDLSVFQNKLRYKATQCQGYENIDMPNIGEGKIYIIKFIMIENIEKIIIKGRDMLLIGFFQWLIFKFKWKFGQLIISGIFNSFRLFLNKSIKVLILLIFYDIYSYFFMEFRILSFLVLFVVGALSQTCCDQNAVVSLEGRGEIRIKPDQAIISIKVKIQQKNTTLSLDSLTKKINDIKTMMKKNNVNESDLTTSKLVIASQKSYSQNIFKLSQKIYIKIRSIASDGSNIGKIVEGIKNISDLTISQIIFDQEDRTKAISQARQAAIQDLKNQIDEYTKMTNLKKSKIRKFSSLKERVVPYIIKGDVFEATAKLIPPRNLTITSRVNARYELSA